MASNVILGSRRILQPGKLRWLRALAWGVAVLVLVSLAVSVVAGLAYVAGAAIEGRPISIGAVQNASPLVDFVAMALMSLACIAAYVSLVSLGEARLPVEFALRPAGFELPVGLALGAAMMSVSVFLLWVGGWITISSSQPAGIWRALGYSVQSGVIEEVLFRLVVLRLLWRAFGVWTALGLSALLFGAMHIVNPNSSWFAAICIAIEAGIMLAGFYILTGRIWVSIGAHAGWNFTQGWIFGAAVSGTNVFAGGPLTVQPIAEVPEFLSGGGFGPEASLAGLFVGTVVGAATLWLAAKRGQLLATDERTEADANPPVPAMTISPS